MLMGPFMQQLRHELHTSLPVEVPCPNMALLHGEVLLERDKRLSYYIEAFGARHGEVKLLELAAMNQDAARACCLCTLHRACDTSVAHVNIARCRKVFMGGTAQPVCQKHGKKLERWLTGQQEEPLVRCLVQLLANKCNKAITVVHKPRNKKNPVRVCVPPFGACPCLPSERGVDVPSDRQCLARQHAHLPQFCRENALPMCFFRAGVMPACIPEQHLEVVHAILLWLRAEPAASRRAVLNMNGLELPLHVAQTMVEGHPAGLFRLSLFWRFEQCLTDDHYKFVSLCAHGHLCLYLNGRAFPPVPVVSHEHHTLPTPGLVLCVDPQPTATAIETPSTPQHAASLLKSAAVGGAVAPAGAGVSHVAVPASATAVSDGQATADAGRVRAPKRRDIDTTEVHDDRAVKMQRVNVGFAVSGSMTGLPDGDVLGAADGCVAITPAERTDTDIVGPHESIQG